jgi:hypothetical protein
VAGHAERSLSEAAGQAKELLLENLLTSKDSRRPFVNHNSAIMSRLGAEWASASRGVGEGALAVNKLPASISEVLPKPGISYPSAVRRLAAISAIVFSAVCAPAVISQQTPAAPQSNGNMESAARSHPLTISVPKPKSATADAPVEEGPSFVRVTSDGNQLTIQAKDCALAQILDAVRAKTGASIDFSGPADEHMTVKIGPGPARQVISSLLGWTDFDYVIQGSDGESVAIQSIMLFPKTKSTQSATGATPALGPNRQPLASRQRATPDPVTPPPAPETPASEGAAPAQPSADATRSEGAPPAQPTADATPPAPGAMPIPTNYERSAENAASTPDPTAGKTTSDMIQDMQSLYEQRRQIQQQHNQTPGAAPLPSH